MTSTNSAWKVAGSPLQAQPAEGGVGRGGRGQSGKADENASTSLAMLLYHVSAKAQRACGCSGSLQMKNRQLNRCPAMAPAYQTLTCVGLSGLLQQFAVCSPKRDTDWGISHTRTHTPPSQYFLDIKYCRSKTNHHFKPQALSHLDIF